MTDMVQTDLGPTAAKYKEEPAEDPVSNFLWIHSRSTQLDFHVTGEERHFVQIILAKHHCYLSHLFRLPLLREI